MQLMRLTCTFSLLLPCSGLLSLCLLSSVLLSFTMGLSNHAMAQVQSENKINFEQCQANFKKEAEKAGFSDFITNDVIGSLRPLERVITLDRSQPEFTQSFGGYIKKRVNAYRIQTGKRMLKEHATLLNSLTQKYGVPARYIVAFWGMETNYGNYKGKIKTLNTLATLACDPRRSQYFTQELTTLFTLLDAKRVSIEQLTGSWAGAMGHMQFMPTTLMTYGVDGDNDGKLNVWESLPDAFTSAANYLQKMGWNKQEIWGRKVELPKDFAFDKVISGKRYPLHHFKQLGVTKSYQRPLPAYETQTKLILPSGHLGPAFLVYANFSIILKWNYSQNYALAIGLLADQLVGIDNGLNHYDTTPHFFTNQDLKALQQALLDKNFDVGKPDGVWGPNTRKAMQQYQLQNGLVGDGFPHKEVFDKLHVKRGVVLDRKTEAKPTQ